MHHRNIAASSKLSITAVSVYLPVVFASEISTFWQNRMYVVITSAEEGGYVFSSVCLSVCLSVSPSDYSQTFERILMKFFGG